MTTKRISIIGLGLIGGSLGLALKKAKGDEIEVIGFARRPEVSAKAMKLGAVDRTELQLTGAVAGADVVIIATPVMATKEILKEISLNLVPDAIVSDVGSTKAQVMKWADEYLPSTVGFVGGHPMTGKETSGIDEIEAELFKGCVYCLTPSHNTRDVVVKTMIELVQWVKAKPFTIDAEQHDKLAAGISHLPMVLSSALVTTLVSDEHWQDMSTLAASGFRDMTRLASGNPELHYGICATNQQALVKWIDKYIENLKEYRRLIQDNGEGLKKSLNAAKSVRNTWLENEGRRFVE